MVRKIDERSDALAAQGSCSMTVGEFAKLHADQLNAWLTNPELVLGRPHSAAGVGAADTNSRSIADRAEHEAG